MFGYIAEMKMILIRREETPYMVPQNIHFLYLLQVKSLVLAVDTRQTDFVVSHEVNDVGCIAKLGTGYTVVSHNKNVSLSEIKLFF
jgi:hypothetical protein